VAKKQMTPEQLEEARRKLFQSLRDESWNRLSSEQKAFLSESTLREQSGQFVLVNEGSQAYLAACGETIRLGMIKTDEDKRGQGHAGRLLRRICELADQHGITLSLRAEPKALKIGLKQKELVQWYKRFGFAGKWNKMIRLPRDLSGSA